MKEAKKRNPQIKLYGLPWGWPGWLDPAASATVQAKNAFANPEVTANYTLAFLLGAKRVHGLHMDYIGQWNGKKPLALFVQKSPSDALCAQRGTRRSPTTMRSGLWWARRRS